MNPVDLLKSNTPKYQETIPSSNKQVWFRPFYVKEEKILLIAQETGQEKEMLRAIANVVESCYEDIVDATKIPLFDLEYLFIKLRSKSVDEVATPVLICPVTEEKITLRVDLDNLEVIKGKNHTTKIKLSDNVLVQMKYPSLSLFISNDLENMELSDVYELALKCIDYIETNDERIDSKNMDNQQMKDFIDNMTKKQFDKIIDFFATMPRIEKTVNYTTSDKEKRSIVLRGIKDFFGLASVIQA
jgi:hypothetical protein